MRFQEERGPSNDWPRGKKNAGTAFCRPDEEKNRAKKKAWLKKRIRGRFWGEASAFGGKRGKRTMIREKKVFFSSDLTVWGSQRKGKKGSVKFKRHFEKGTK